MSVDNIEGAKIVELGSVSSTQDAARDLLRTGKSSAFGVRAEFQSKGRGRSGSGWAAPSGQCLLVTYMLPLDGGPETAGMLALALGVALADAVDYLTGMRAGLKWPNDVLLAGKKVAGILIETERDKNGDWWALSGVGLNVNVGQFPPELEGSATSLTIITGKSYNIREVEQEVRSHIQSAAKLLELGPKPIVQAWRERDMTQGMIFKLDIAEQSHEGTAMGIADSGALILRMSDGGCIEVFSATSLS